MSMRIDANIQFNPRAIERRLDNSVARAQQWLNNEIVKDSNYFAPMDTGDLQRSAVRYTAANPRVKQVRWDTPYATRLYYGDRFKFSKDSNPNARARWFEAAKRVKQRVWITGVERIIGGAF